VYTTSPKFRIAWGTANKFSAQRARNLRELGVVEVARTQTPEKLVPSLAVPNNVTRIKALRKVLPTENFQRFQEAFKNQLLNDPDNLTKRLAEFDSETLDLLLPRGVQSDLRSLGISINKLNILKTSQKGALQTSNRAFVREFFANNPTGATQALRTLIAKEGGKDAFLGRSVRASIMDNAMERMFTNQKTGILRGSKTISIGAVESVIEELTRSGQISLLKKADVAFLRSMRGLSANLARSTDAGTSILAAEIAASSVKLNQPRTMVSAWLAIARHSTVSRIYLAGPTRRFMLGGPGGVHTLGVPLRTAAAIASTLVDDGKLEPNLRELINNGT